MSSEENKDIESSQLLALELDLCLKGVMELSWYGDRGKMVELLLFISLPRDLAASALFFILSLDSPYVARLLCFCFTTLVAASGFNVHHDDLPASSLGTFRNL